MAIRDELIMPIVYQSIKGDVALDIVTHGPHMNLCDLIARLDNNFGVVSDEDTLMKELYTIKQGTKESVKRFNTCIGYTMMRLAAAFPHAMPTERRKKQEKLISLAGYAPTLNPPCLGNVPRRGRSADDLWGNQRCG